MGKRYKYFAFDDPYKMLATSLLADYTTKELQDLADSPLLMQREAAQSIKAHLDFEGPFADCIIDMISQRKGDKVSEIEDDIAAILIKYFDSKKAAQYLSELLSEIGLSA